MNIKPLLYHNETQIKQEYDHIILITEKQQAEQYPLPKTISKAIEHTFSQKKMEVIDWAEDQYRFIVIIPEKEAEQFRIAGALLYKVLETKKSTAAIVETLENVSQENRIAFLEGLFLSSYSFKRHKNNVKKEQVSIYIKSEHISKNELEELLIIVKAVGITKDMVNEPLNYMDALVFSETAGLVAKEFGFQTDVLHKKQIEDLNMGGLLAVNRGSETPPTFNIFKYKPENAINEKPIVLIGKGVMFDTGGYSLKIGGTMSTMKDDMAGGAAVLGTIAAIAGNKLPYYVIGLVPATDNKIAPDALVVDDIITMMNGTTVEVQNTDAEGRLVLADALTYATKFTPELVIDVATLTGASAAITGSLGIAMAGNDKAEMEKLRSSGEKVYERLFELPFWKEYEELLQSDIADLKNIGGPIGGASTAGKFLEHFTEYPWIHLDIAGAAFIKEAKGYKQAGATAIAVRLLYHFIKKRVTHD